MLVGYLVIALALVGYVLAAWAYVARPMRTGRAGRLERSSDARAFTRELGLRLIAFVIAAVLIVVLLWRGLA